MIYLDHAAATPLDRGVLAAMQPYFADKFYNPSATYLAAEDVKKDLEAARARVAGILGCRSQEVTFTAGGTEANNLAIRGIMEQFPGSNVVVSAIEHESVIEPAKRFQVKLAPVTPDGIVEPAKLVKLINDETALVSVMYANNEVGSIQPIRELSAELAKIRAVRRQKGNSTPLYFHTDAAQAGNYLDLHVARLGVDLMSLNGGKIYGPKQSGVLFIKAGTQLQPQILGGGQEYGQRSGTENVAGDIGLAAALEMVQHSRRAEAERLQKLQKIFFDLLATQLPQAVINGSLRHRLPNNIHITIPGHDNERLLIRLEEAGILAAAGSACSASNEQPSHVLKAMGLKDAEARASLRLTMGRPTTEAMVRKAVKVLASLV